MLAAKFVPVPSALVFHPLNVYPVFVNGFAGVFIDAFNVPVEFIYTVGVKFAGAVPLVEPFPLNLTVICLLYET